MRDFTHPKGSSDSVNKMVDLNKEGIVNTTEEYDDYKIPEGVIHICDDGKDYSITFECTPTRI